MLRCGGRIGGLRNFDIQESSFLEDIKVSQSERLNTFLTCMTEVEQQGCGIKHVKDIGQRYARLGQPWYVGLGAAPDFEDKAISKAIAEWADGDSIASHLAYKNDYFCTLDFGKGSGPDSILSPQNRDWLTSQYGVKFVTPEQLVANL